MQNKVFYLEKLFQVQQELHDILIEVSHGLNQFYLDPDSWEVSMKRDASPVTTADHYCHQLLCKRLEVLGFDIPIISEESSDVEMTQLKANPPEVYWLVDPLDGTSGFVNGTGHFAVNVALIYCMQPIAGWIAWPRVGMICWAFGDIVYRSGSFCFDVVRPESLEVVTSLRMKYRNIIFSSSGQNSRKKQVMFEVAQMLEKPVVFQLGSAIKFCAMFQGYGGFYPRLAGTCLWDLAAGQVLLRARGGDIFFLNG